MFILVDSSRGLVCVYCLYVCMYVCVLFCASVHMLYYFSCYEFIVFYLTIYQEPEPFYFWKVGAGAAENRVAPKLCIIPRSVRANEGLVKL